MALREVVEAGGRGDLMTIHVGQFKSASKRRIVSSVASHEELRLSQREWLSLNRLIGYALVNDAACQRLIVERDPGLLTEFGISARVQEWVQTLSADSLVELAEKMMECSPNASRQRSAIS